ncbi:MAG: hypothetical protein R3F59_36055 [Myxococcota bacterium]
MTGGALSGTVSQGADGLDYALSGFRDAALHADTVRRGERDRDASLTLVSLSGTADGDEVYGPFALEAAYDGWAGGSWDLSVAADGDGALEGTLTGPAGRTCTVTGEAGYAEITCSP